MNGPILKELMQTTNFRVTVVAEADVVEICGALKVRGPPFVLNKVSLVCQTITGLTHSAVTLIRC